MNISESETFPLIIKKKVLKWFILIPLGFAGHRLLFQLPKGLSVPITWLGIGSFITTILLGWFGTEDSEDEGLGIFWNMLAGKKPEQ